MPDAATCTVIVRHPNKLHVQQGLDASNKQRTPRLGLRARALDLPLQASRTSSHDLDMAHSPPVLGAHPNPNPRYILWQAHVCCLLDIVYLSSSIEYGLRGPSSSVLPLIACCSLAVAIIACSPLPVTCCICSFNWEVATSFELASGIFLHFVTIPCGTASRLPVVPFKQCNLLLPAAWHKCCTEASVWLELPWWTSWWITEQKGRQKWCH